MIFKQNISKFKNILIISTLFILCICLSAPLTLQVPAGTPMTGLDTGISYKNTGWLFYLVYPDGTEASLEDMPSGTRSLQIVILIISVGRQYKNY